MKWKWLCFFVQLLLVKSRSSFEDEDVREILTWLSQNLDTQICSHLVGILDIHQRNNTIEVSVECTEFLLKIFTNSSLDYVESQLVLALTSINQTQMIKLLKNNDMRREAAVLKLNEKSLHEMREDTGRLNVMKKPNFLSANDNSTHLSVNSAEVITAVITISLFLTFLLLYLLTLLFERLTRIPPEFTYSQYDLLIQ